MEPDRVTQAFLSRFTEPILQEAERLRKEGAVKQIFGGAAFVRARVEEGGDVYRVMLKREAHGWEWELTGPESQHPAVVAAAMLERVSRGEALPDSPNEVGDASLLELIEEKLGRSLSPMEDVFVEKLEKRYRRYEMEQALFDTDLVRLSPKWTVESYEPVTIWPEPPKDILQFWNYIAAAFERKRIVYPPFMEVITEKEATKEQMRAWEREREMAAWQARVDRVIMAPVTPPRHLELRLLLTTREAKLQQRVPGQHPPGDYENIVGEVDLGKLRQAQAQGQLLLDDVSESLVSQWAGYWSAGDVPSPTLRLESYQAREFLGQLLRQRALSERLVTLDETPFFHVADPLRWECQDPAPEQESEGAYGLQLTMADGEPVPYALTVLPGPATFYLSDEAVFRGPRPWMDTPEAMPRYDVPAEVVESETGVDFLRRLDVALPPGLKSRAVEAVLQPRLMMKLAKRGPAADAEVVQAEVMASDDDLYRTEILERDTWRVEQTRRFEDGRLPWFDRRALYAVPDYLAEIGLAWDGAGKFFKARLTKTFPDKFVKWLDALPKEVSVELDGDLKSLRADPVKASVKFEITEAGEIDWFDLKVMVEVEGMDLTRQQIRDLVEARGGFVRMPSGAWLRLELSLTHEQEAAVSQLGLDVYDLSGETHRMHVLQLAEPGAVEIFDPEAWNRVCDRASRLKLQIRPPVPAGFQLQLRPYQIEGFHFLAYLATNRFGGILADDMGLGKTAQSICWILWLRERAEAAALAEAKGGEPKPVSPVLVVAPKSVLDVWAGEVTKFAPSLRVQVVRDKAELDVSRLGTEFDLLVLNYSQLRVNGDKLKSITWLTIVLDEGQQIKNPDSMAARSARELTSDHRLVLSGTPIENRLLDVWSLMAFAMPGVLGNRKYFKDRFDRRKDTGAQVRLGARLRPFLLRRTKGQVALDLPSRTEEDMYSALEEVQEELYNAELQRMQRILLGLDSDAALRKNSFVILQGLMRLRQICCHPGLIDDKYAETPSAKLTALFYLLDQLREANHKVLVFSQFTSMLDIIKARLDAEQRPHVMLTGQTKDRQTVVQEFQSSKEPLVFLLSLKAGGSGLNLTAASYVIMYDPWWNPAVESQAIDRTHRIGQTNPVIAYRLLAANTVEEKIRRLQYQKQSLVTGVLGEESFASNLALDDVRSLFTRDETPEPLKKGKSRGQLVRDF
ncbi:MAG: Non-specific serine/threonine protein kinase [Verrucomicrobiales bacterium]|nr:Non-specific serine/threonine protein kinase [Verrucomicrobiales bacterium]